MKLATQTCDFSGYTLVQHEKLEYLARTPFKYFDFTLGMDFLDGSWRDEIKRCISVAEKHGMTFIQAHSRDIYPFHKNRNFDDEMKQIAGTLEACSMLGIPQVVLHPVIPEGSDAKYPDGKEAFFEYNKKLFSLVFPLMEKYNVMVLIENSAEMNTGGKYFFMTGQDMREFLDMMDHPLLKAVWDTGHANMRGNNQYEDLMALGDYLVGLHVHDNDGNRDEHTAPFMGTLNLDALMKGIIDSGYKGYFTFESNNTLLRGGGWPYKRKPVEGIEDNRLLHPCVELKIQAECLLYEIGKYILQQYNMFEE